MGSALGVVDEIEHAVRHQHPSVQHRHRHRHGRGRRIVARSGSFVHEEFARGIRLGHRHVLMLREESRKQQCEADHNFAKYEITTRSF